MACKAALLKIGRKPHAHVRPSLPPEPLHVGFLPIPARQPCGSRRPPSPSEAHSPTCAHVGVVWPERRGALTLRGDSLLPLASSLLRIKPSAALSTSCRRSHTQSWKSHVQVPPTSLRRLMPGSDMHRTWDLVLIRNGQFGIQDAYCSFRVASFVTCKRLNSQI